MNDQLKLNLSGLIASSFACELFAPEYTFILDDGKFVWE